MTRYRAVSMNDPAIFVAFLPEGLPKRGAWRLALVGWAAWACAVPTNSAPPVDERAAGGLAGTGGDTGGSSNGGTAGSAMAGSSTGGSMTGGTSTGGAMTGGATTGGAMTGGAMTGGAMTGGSSGASTGGTMAGGGGAGMGGRGGMGGSAAGSAGKGGSPGGAGGAGGAGGSGGTGGMPSVLSHRYSFDGNGTQAMDSIGTAHGTITGGMQGSGRVTLSGTDQYVTLPNTILDGLSAATLEVWSSWTGTRNWERLFDFGNNGADTGDQGSFSANATSSYFFFTPRAGPSNSSPACMGTGNTPLVSITGSGPSMEACILNAPAFPSGMTHVALAIDGSALRLYIDGAPVGTATAPVSLGSITKSHNCLGRSQYAQDPEFTGSIDEFRIYPTARTAAQLSASESAGPGSVPTQ